MSILYFNLGIGELKNATIKKFNINSLSHNYLIISANVINYFFLICLVLTKKV